MRHRTGIGSGIRRAVAAIVASAAVGIVAAAPAPGSHRVLYICDCPAAQAAEERSGVLQALAALGYVQGRNLDLVSYDIDNSKTPYAEMLPREFAAARTDLVLASGVRIAEALRQVEGAPPVVFWRLTDPVGLGLVASLARPQGNLTGFSRGIEKLTVKRLELLHEMVPGARRIAFVSFADNASHRRQWAEVRAAAPALGLEMSDVSLPSDRWTADELDALFAPLRKSGVDALLLPDLNGAPRTLVALAAKYRLPTIHSLTHVVTEWGGLAAYATVANGEAPEVADYADRILKGTKPRDLPVQEPSRFELVLNARAARELGLIFPPRFLLRASQVIEK